jgi:hypothetical protein
MLVIDQQGLLVGGDSNCQDSSLLKTAVALLGPQLLPARLRLRRGLLSVPRARSRGVCESTRQTNPKD